MRAQGRHAQVLREVRGQVLRQAREKDQVWRQERRPEVRSQMHAEVRAQELMAGAGRSGLLSRHGDRRAAGWRLLNTYAELAQRGKHLFEDALNGQLPRQWRHYPEEDAIDHRSGYQWFYHAHSPEDRQGSAEHGHIHLFACRKLWSKRLRSARELTFSELAAGAYSQANTRHLLAIGFDAKGIATSLFTVNSWVTGDLMLSGKTTARLLENMTLDTGHAPVDAVIECIVSLCQEEIRCLLAARDQNLFNHQTSGVLQDENLELLSEVAIDLDAKLSRL